MLLSSMQATVHDGVAIFVWWRRSDLIVRVVASTLSITGVPTLGASLTGLMVMLTVAVLLAPLGSLAA